MDTNHDPSTHGDDAPATTRVRGHRKLFGAIGIAAVLALGGSAAAIGVGAQEGTPQDEPAGAPAAEGETAPQPADGVVGDDEYEALEQQFEQCLEDAGVDLDAAFEIEESGTDDEIEAVWEMIDPALEECESVFDGVMHEDDVAWEQCLADSGISLDELERAEEEAGAGGATGEDRAAVWAPLEPKGVECDIAVGGEELEDFEGCLEEGVEYDDLYEDETGEPTEEEPAGESDS